MKLKLISLISLYFSDVATEKNLQITHVALIKFLLDTVALGLNPP